MRVATTGEAPTPASPTAGRLTALLGVPGLAAAYLAYAAAGVAAGAAALLALTFGGVLVALVFKDEQSVERRTADHLARAGLLLLPGALTVYLCFNRGGYFPDGPAFGTIVLATVLVVRNALAAKPFEGFTRQAGIAAGALGLLAIWTLLSAQWSESVERALIEYDRVLLYGLALVLFASLPERLRDLRWMLRGLALGIAAVCLIALITRTLPEVWPIDPNIAQNRLSYPLGYWNALGILASIGLILCLHLGSCEREPRVVRILGCAACPLLAAVLLLTFSRGAIAVTVIGLVAYAVVARPRALLTGLAAGAPAVAAALVVTYRADQLASEDPTAAAAIAQGREVALALILCAVGAAVLRTLLLPADARLARLRLAPPVRRRLVASAGAVAIAAGLFVAVGTEAPNRLDEQYDRFVAGTAPAAGGRVRDRLTDPSSNGRIEHWRVALRGFDLAPLTGEGAGTFELLWERDRPATSGEARDAHSLYAEVAGELGVVGLMLVIVAIGAILLAAALRARGVDRAPYGAVFAAGLAWAVHAGIDWDWEMAATGLWFFALGGAVLARGSPKVERSEETSLPRRALASCLVLVMAAPAALIGVSQVHIDESTEAFGRGDCDTALESAASATATIDVRAAPEEISGYCYARRGLTARSLRALQAAIAHDPQKPEAHYGLAVVRAAAGLDPRQAAREAVRLDPRDPIARDAVRAFDTNRPSKWKRAAMDAPLSLSREGPFVDFSELSAKNQPYIPRRARTYGTVRSKILASSHSDQLAP